MLACFVHVAGAALCAAALWNFVAGATFCDVPKMLFWFREVLERSVVGRRVVEKCWKKWWKGVLEKRVAEKCCRRVLERSVREEGCREVSQRRVL